MMCATPLFSMSVGALFPGQRVQTAGCTRVNDLHPQTSLFLELYQSGDSRGFREPETGHLSKDQTNITRWMHPCCTHQLDCELKQREREAVACTRAEPRGTLWLLEHEGDSCSAACTNTAVCYLNSGYTLRLQINFKAKYLRCPPTHMFSVFKGLILP